MELIEITNRELLKMTREKIKERMGCKNVERRSNQQNKSKSVHGEGEEIRGKQIHNNRPSSMILNKARTKC